MVRAFASVVTTRTSRPVLTKELPSVASTAASAPATGAAGELVTRVDLVGTIGVAAMSYGCFLRQKTSRRPLVVLVVLSAILPSAGTETSDVTSTGSASAALGVKTT